MPIEGLYLLILALIVPITGHCEDLQASDVQSVSPYSPGSSRIKTTGARVIIDGLEEVTKPIQVDRYVDFIAISTPTTLPKTNHSQMYLSTGSSVNQICTQFSNGSSTCFAGSGGQTAQFLVSPSTGLIAGTFASNLILGNQVSLSTGVTGVLPVANETILQVSPSTGIIAGNLASNLILLNQVSLSTGVTGSLPAASIASGVLGSAVIASSVSMKATILNQSTLQVGSTAYPDFLQVNTSETFKSANLQVNGVSYSWPSSQSSNFLKNDGSGNLTWSAPSASAGGNNTQIQYNNGGVLGGLPSAVSASSVTISTPTAILGTITNDNAIAGYYGEYVSSSTTSSTGPSLTSGQFNDVAAVTLTAGDWDLSLIACSNNSSASVSVTDADTGVGTTAGNSSAGLTFGDTEIYMSQTVSTSNDNPCGVVPVVRKSIASTTTFYGKIRLSWTTGTETGYGRLSARRIR